MDYGGQILKASILDHWPQLKNRLITMRQYRILNFSGGLARYSPLDKVMSKFVRRFVGSYLYSVKLEVNTSCTLGCKMCYIHENGKQFSFETICMFLDQIRSCGVRLEILGGEPLLRKDITEIVSYAKDKAEVPFVTLYTNGLAATNGMSSALHDAGLDAAIVTLISHRKEVHDAFTGVKGSWDQTVEGIRNLIRAKVATYTFTAIHSDNYTDFEDIDKFVRKDLGAHALFYQYIPQKAGDPLTIPRETWHRIKHSVLMEKNRPHMEFVRKFYMLTGNACSGGNFVLTIKANGEVQPCPFISDLPIGNIYHSSIWDIYRNRYRHTQLREFKKLPDECAGCSYGSVCSGGCKAGNNILFGSYSHRDHRCQGPYNERFDHERVLDCVPTFF